MSLVSLLVCFLLWRLWSIDIWIHFLGLIPSSLSVSIWDVLTSRYLRSHPVFSTINWFLMTDNCKEYYNNDILKNKLTMLLYNHLTLYIYIYIYIYICTHIHTYIHTYIYIHIYTYTYIHTYIYIHIYIHTYIHVYMCVCVCACICVCVFYYHIYNKCFIYFLIIQIYTYIYMCVCVCVCVCVCLYFIIIYITNVLLYFSQ